MKKKRPRARKPAGGNQDAAKREAVLDERESLQQLFPASYEPEIAVFSDGKVEVMLRLTYAQAEKLAHQLKKRKL